MPTAHHMCLPRKSTALGTPTLPPGDAGGSSVAGGGTGAELLISPQFNQATQRSSRVPKGTHTPSVRVALLPLAAVEVGAGV
ncbi:hypothetical protein H2248_003181 [Termitomyces sp. 'cryptogamus']|nr:hypothetical protein H2248_003181 [Termitomyces sp. 'cryptogamus']